MKKLLPLVLLLCVSFSSSAQLFGRRSTPSPLVTHEDSVAFIRHIFKEERRSGRLGVVTSGTALVSIVTSLSTDKRLQQSAWRMSLAGAGGAAMVYISVLDIMKWGRFSKRREEETVRRFEQHQPQPLYVQQRLMLAYARLRK